MWLVKKSSVSFHLLTMEVFFMGVLNQQQDSCGAQQGGMKNINMFLAIMGFARIKVA